MLISFLLLLQQQTNLVNKIIIASFDQVSHVESSSLRNLVLIIPFHLKLFYQKKIWISPVYDKFGTRNTAGIVNTLILLRSFRSLKITKQLLFWKRIFCDYLLLFLIDVVSWHHFILFPNLLRKNSSYSSLSTRFLLYLHKFRSFSIYVHKLYLVVFIYLKLRFSQLARLDIKNKTVVLFHLSKLLFC